MKIGIYGDRTPPLGQLERDVLDRLWDGGVQSAQEVHAALRARRALTLSTVQTTLERLRRKHLLIRRKQGRSYLYSAAVGRPQLLSRMVTDLVGALSSGRESLSIASLIEFDETVDEAALDRLEEWIRKRRQPPQEEQ